MYLFLSPTVQLQSLIRALLDTCLRHVYRFSSALICISRFLGCPRGCSTAIASALCHPRHPPSLSAFPSPSPANHHIQFPLQQTTLATLPETLDSKRSFSVHARYSVVASLTLNSLPLLWTTIFVLFKIRPLHIRFLTDKAVGYKMHLVKKNITVLFTSSEEQI